MTKYILGGGNYFAYPEKASDFFKEALSGLGESPTILWCFFASELEERRKRYQQYTSQVAEFYPEGTSPVSLEATEESFVEQANSADVINIQGGSTRTLRATLEPYDLEALFANKVVAGHSAGANVMASSFWSPGLRQFGQGFGIFPIKTLTHFGSNYGADDIRGPIDWTKAQEALKTYGNLDHEVLTLEEGQFVVLEN